LKTNSLMGRARMAEDPGESARKAGLRGSGAWAGGRRERRPRHVLVLLYYTFVRYGKSSFAPLVTIFW
jgi:hypothetical protein